MDEKVFNANKLKSVELSVGLLYDGNKLTGSWYKSSQARLV